MSSELHHTLKDFVSLQRGTTYKGGHVGLPGPVLLGLASIEANGGFRYGGFKTYGGDCPAKITLQPGDIYVSLKDVTQSGSLLGAVARVPDDIGIGRLTQDTVKLVFDGLPISREYLYWLLRTPGYRDYCRGCATGTTTLGLARDDFLNYPVPSPTPADHVLIEVLEGIEKRITLLRETNKTLESVAQAIFKSWFVDFDPVRAKMEGRQPEGMDEETAALFPDSFEESQLGLIPRGWSVGQQSALLKLHKGSVNPGATPNTEYLHYSLPAYDADMMAKKELGATIKSNKTTVPKNAVLFSKLNPVIPRVWLPVEFGPHAICSTEFLPFVPTSKSNTPFIYCLMKSRGLRDQIVPLASGTSNSHQRIRPDNILSLINVLPNTLVMKRFEAVVEPLLARTKANQLSVQLISAIRDTLLPSLISGQLRLPETAYAN